MGIVELIPASFVAGGVLMALAHGGIAMLSQEGTLMKKKLLTKEHAKFDKPRVVPKQTNYDEQRPVQYPERVRCSG